MASSINPLTATASELQDRLCRDHFSSKDLVKLYMHRISKYDGYLKSVIATAPEDLVLETASRLDEERTRGILRGPLHGIPIVIKDNIATVPELGLPTTCGSLALEGSRPRKNAAIVDKVWSPVSWEEDCRSRCCPGMGILQVLIHASSQSPGGSSGGSAVAVSAGLSPLAIGTDTMGSLIAPSDRAALYTIRPTLKIVPQQGIIPITLESDSAGPMAKSVLDLALLLDALVDPTATEVPEQGYKGAVTGKWGDIRIGVIEPSDEWLFQRDFVKFEPQASEQMGLLEEYLASVDDCKVRTLEELVQFNKDHAEKELPPCADNQDTLIRALSAHMPDDEYRSIISSARERCGKNGIDKALAENDVDVIIGPGDGPMFCVPSTAGYPVASLPLGYLDFNGRPFGMQITAGAHQEALIIQAQSAWEHTFPFRRPPPLDDIVPVNSTV
ncbi:amidase [Geosmithia morbida]|uniref:Amidase n=1 Tax=Geosmithia morbida TaxID=1094350 RepID=A0A9P4Z056_9HYPO|nr:amidase [Geosmithia morbida]KAF4124991.1 amidase [Geosmithia morbida]